MKFLSRIGDIGRANTSDRKEVVEINQKQMGLLQSKQTIRVAYPFVKNHTDWTGDFISVNAGE